ncbi:aminopeptidase P family protein [Pinirhizobacter sp.]|jgi:Xaa-Pro aminopeptidase|uniref:aminopeptidase P family protein n=1 Tax=Pinirhizobacter sp. TaxID=2950432 RepID=UPI002F40ECFE
MDSLLTHAARLSGLRQAMRRHGVAACIIPSADPHLSEYLPAHWQARTWTSGFTGSAGTLVVTAEDAGLWTDSRYFSQAEQELAASGIRLVKLQVAHTAEHVAWLSGVVGEGDVVAVAGDSLSLAGREQLRRALVAHLRTDLDLPGENWPDRPPLPRAPVVEHPLEYARSTRDEKLGRVRHAMKKLQVSHHFVSTLDDIGWITNLRGSDVPYNPVFLAHLLVGPSRATLFVDRGKVEPALQSRLAADGFDIADYATAASALAGLPTESRLLVDPSRVVCALVDATGRDVTLVHGANPSTMLKARKQAAELDHIRETMRHDGAALARGFHQIETRLAGGDALTEVSVEEILREARAKCPSFIGESFATIAGYQANGALPHYRATPEHHSTLRPAGLLLIDSGGQYLGGTTDITRVLALGEVTDEQKRDATLVLKGMIGLSRARFPAGASGPQLDALARAPLWAAGMDFGHGTGHGVGYFLNVHEGPHGIRPPVQGGALVPLEPGMVTSIEPGLYKPGRHGIRHENLAVVVESNETEFGRFLAFETLTLCPFDRRALEPRLLDPAERAWLDDYHACVRAALAPLLDGAERAWLEWHCAPLAA